MAELNIQALPKVLEQYIDPTFIERYKADPTITDSIIRNTAIHYARRGNVQETASCIKLYVATHENNSLSVFYSAARLMHAALRNGERSAIRDADRFRTNPELAYVAGNLALCAIDARRNAARLER